MRNDNRFTPKRVAAAIVRGLCANHGEVEGRQKAAELGELLGDAGMSLDAQHGWLVSPVSTMHNDIEILTQLMHALDELTSPPTPAPKHRR